MSNYSLRPVLSILAIVAVCFSTTHGQAQEKIAVRAALEKTEVSVGEPVLLQIQVQGSDQVQGPDLSVLQELNPVELGKGNTNRSYVSNINGNVTRNVFRGYQINLRLTPAREGNIPIPPLRVIIDGTEFQTQPLILRVGQAEQSQDFKMQLVLPRTTVYKGETLPLEIVWYVSKQPEQFLLSAPVLKQPGLRIHTPELPANATNREYLAIKLNDEETWGKLGETELDGKHWQTLTIQRYLTPDRTGILELAPATVSGSIIAGYQKTKNASPFGDMLEDSPFGNDPFFTGKQPILKKFFAASAPVKLTILELPAADKPADFSGIIGKVSIATKVEPDEASVGEPLSLTVMLTGSDYLPSVELPDLQKQSAFASGFRIPADRPSAKILGGVKVFTQTIRARSASIKEIPAIHLSYFNPDKNRYETATSKAIPLTIHEAKIVTASDIEGGKTGDNSSTGTEVISTNTGILHNHAVTQCLNQTYVGIRHWLNAPFWLTALVLPPTLWLFLVALQWQRNKRNADPLLRAARNARQTFLQAISGNAQTSSARPEIILSALRDYLRDKLQLTTAVHGYVDVEQLLQNHATPSPLLQQLQTLFAACEEATYTRAAPATQTDASLAAHAISLVEALECHL